MKKNLFVLFAILFSVNMTALCQGQKWLASARKGNVNAMYQVALHYHLGFDGIPKDISKAKIWAEKAGNNGNVQAMLLAGRLYDDLKTKKFASKELYWNKRAAEAGSLDGMMYTRSNYIRLNSYLSTNSDKIKCVEQIIYWNNQMLAHPELEEEEREFCKRSVGRYEKELSELKENQ